MLFQAFRDDFRRHWALKDRMSFREEDLDVHQERYSRRVEWLEQKHEVCMWASWGRAGRTEWGNG